MSKAVIVLQDNEESRYIVEAIEQDNSDATVIHQPAMIRVENEGSIVIKRKNVEAVMGRDWDVQELHVNVVTIAGHVDEDDEQITLFWNS